MYTLQEFKDRHSPQNWGIVSNNGTALIAKNILSGEPFSGTPLEFKSLTTKPFPGDISPVYDSNGVFFGFRDSSGKESPLRSNNGVFRPQDFKVSAGTTNGVDDDTDAIKLAIAAAVAYGDGAVDLGAATYRCTTPIGVKITKPITVRGDGAKIFIDTSMVGDWLSFSNTWYGSDVVVNEDGSAGVGTSLTGARWNAVSDKRNGVRLMGFKLFGNRLTPNVQNGIVFYDRNDNITIRDVDINFIKGHALVLSGLPSNKAVNAASVIRESEINNLHIRRCGDRLSARASLVMNSTDKGSASFDDACNYTVLTNVKLIFSDGVAFQSNCYNLNSNGHSNNRVQLIIDAPVNCSGASVAGSVCSISTGILTVNSGGTQIGTLAVGQYIIGANVPMGTYIGAQLTGTAGGQGTYQLINNVFDASTINVSAGGFFATMRTNIPVVMLDGGHSSEEWDITLNASNLASTGAWGVSFNQNWLHQNGAKTVNSILEITNGNLDVAIFVTVLSSLNVRYKLRNASTTLTALAVNQSLVLDLLERGGADPAIGGDISRVFVKLGGQEIVSSTDFAGMNAAKFPNCILHVKNGSVYTKYVSDGTSWIAL